MFSRVAISVMRVARPITRSSNQTCPRAIAFTRARSGRPVVLGQHERTHDDLLPGGLVMGARFRQADWAVALSAAARPGPGYSSPRLNRWRMTFFWRGNACHRNVLAQLRDRASNSEGGTFIPETRFT